MGQINTETKTPGNGGSPLVPQVVEPEKALGVHNSLMPTTLNEKFKFAQVLVKSGLIPKHFNTPEKAMVALQIGHELGLKPMMSLNNIYVIDQKPALMASLMMAILTNHPEYCGYHEEYDNEDHPVWCRVTISRIKHGTVIDYSSRFSLEDAKTALLLGKDNWKKYPKAMLTARAQAATARKAFPDILAGMYTPEELTDGGNGNLSGIPETQDHTPDDNFEDFMARLDSAKTIPEVEKIAIEIGGYEFSEDKINVLKGRYILRKQEIVSNQRPPETQDPPKQAAETTPLASSKLEEYKREIKAALERGDTKTQINLMKAGRDALGDQYKDLVTYTNSLSKKSA